MESKIYKVLTSKEVLEKKHEETADRSLLLKVIFSTGLAVSG